MPTKWTQPGDGMLGMCPSLLPPIFIHEKHILVMPLEMALILTYTVKRGI